MALTSNDETDLLLPLYSGIRETPRFATFLDRLKRRTGAQYVSLALRRDGAPMSEAEVWFSGRDLHRQTLQIGEEMLRALDPALRSDLRPYRVYGTSDLAEHDPAYRAARAGADALPGPIADQRLVRIPLDAGVSGWLIVARDRACTAADSALVSNLVPYVQTALRVLRTLERETHEAALSAESQTRAGTGWMLFDGEARLLAIEPATALRLAAVTGTEPQIGERLRGITGAAERTLAETAHRLTSGNREASAAILLSEEPRVEAVLAASGIGGSGPLPYPSAVMTAYCRFSAGSAAAGAGHFAGLHDLPRREAELAMALSDGLSLAEAAEAMGLTIETARNYSKRLYAKLGVRGQAELVRLVHRSSAVLA